MIERRVARTLQGTRLRDPRVDARIWAASKARDCEGAAAAWRSVPPASLRAAIDLGAPAEWYAAARAGGPRRIIACVGPTNSGKTHGALARLVGAARAGGNGVYCAPLRLLAVETWRRLRAEHGVACALVTGETRVPAGSTGDPWTLDASALRAPDGLRADPLQSRNDRINGHAGLGPPFVEPEPTAHSANGQAGGELTSCTVEMADLGREYSVAVVDEAQLAADAQRGWAFTAALLGLRARELYVCGEEAVVPLLEAIARETGDVVEVRRHERLSPLAVESSGLGGAVARLMPGDAVVCFSRKDLYDLRAAIDASRGRSGRDPQCAIVYGRMPVETRVAQAAAFNERRAGFLVASDAIGLGLNLRISRIVFASVAKGGVPVAAATLRQIAGRAGRFGAGVSEGRVTALLDSDLPAVAAALSAPAEPYTRAGLQPPADRMIEASRRLPSTSLEALMAAVGHAAAPSHYSPGYSSEQMLLAHLLGQNPRMHAAQRLALATAPVAMGRVPDLVAVAAFEHMTACLALARPCGAPLLSAVCASHPLAATDALGVLESYCRVADLYLWLAARHGDVFWDAASTLRMRAVAVARIARMLDMPSHTVVPRTAKSRI